MKTAPFLVLVCVFGFGSVAPLRAGEVVVYGVHLCCGACTKAIDAGLADVEGVSDVECDLDKYTVTFAAIHAKAATAGVKALTDAGFSGLASYEDRKVKLPRPKRIKGNRADRVALDGVHICCSWCRDEALAWLEAVEGVERVLIPRNKGPQKTIVLTGKDIDPIEAFDELLEAGLYGKLAREEVPRSPR